MKQKLLIITTLAGCLLLSGCWEQQSQIETEMSPEAPSEESHLSKALGLDQLLNGRSAVEAFHEAIGNGNVVVDFYATWCPPCKAMLPIIDELSQELDTVTFIKIDVDKFGEIASGFKVGDESFSIGSVPQFFIFKDGKLQDHFNGGLPKAQFHEKIKNKLGL